MKRVIDRLLQNYDGGDWLLQRKAKTLLALHLIAIAVFVVEGIISSLLLGHLAPECIPNLTIVFGSALVILTLARGRYHVAAGWGIVVVVVGISWTRYASTGQFSSDASYDFLQYVLDLILVLFYANLIAHRRFVIVATFSCSMILLGIYAYALPMVFHNAISSTTASVFISGFLFLVFAGLISLFTFLQNQRAIDIASQESNASKESERNYREIFNSTNEAIFIHDALSGQLLDVNDAMLKMYGFETKTVVHTHSIGDLSANVPPYTNREAEEYLQNAQFVGPQTFEWLAQKITGEQFWVEVSMRKTEIGGQGRILAVVRDVSERKRAEEALRIAHERLADMIEYFPDPTFVIDKESRVIAWNHAMEVLSGVAKTEMLGKGDYAYAVPFFGKRQPILIDMLDAPPSELDSVYKFVKMVGDRLYAESYMQAVYQGKGAHLWGVAAPLYDHTGTRWGTIEVIRDVTDRIESAERLQESERKVRAIFDLSFGFIGVLTLDGTLVEANKTALDFAGVQLSDVLGKPFWETPWWSHSQEMQNRVRIAIMSAANGDLIQSEATHLAQDGTPHTIDFTLKPVMNEAGRVTMLIAEGRDITERKRAEEALRENEERMRAIVEGTPDLFFYTQDADAMTTYVSPTVEHITGYTPGIWLQRKDWFVTDAAINQIARKRTRAHLRGQFTGETILMEVRHALGHPILLEAYEYPISKNERVVGLQGVAHDITQRKRAEEALRESEERYRTFVEQSVDGLLLVDEKGILREWNLAMERMTGIPCSEVKGRPWIEYMEMSVLPERRSPERLEHLRKSAETMLHRGVLPGGKRVFEIEMLRRDGKRIVVQQTLFSMSTSAGFRIGSINRDITLIKQAETSLRKNEMLHRLITENVPDVIWTLDFKTGKFSYVSDSVQKLRGFTPAEVMSQSIAETMTPESLAIVTEMMQKGIDERKPGERGMLVKELEVEQLCKDGSLVPTEVRVTTLFDEQGQPIEFIGISRDITERKRAEVALRESEERFRTLSSIASEGLMIHEQGVIVDANPAFATLIGYSSPDELIGKNGFETVQFTPESRQLVLDQMRTNSDDAYDIEIIQVSGKIVPAETKGTEIVYKGRKARLVSMRDITERKRAESALRESESRFRQIAENIHEVFFLCEKEGNKLLYVNPACTSIFGVTPEMLKADGTLSHRVIHPDDLSNVTYVDAERFYSAPIDEEYRILRPVDGAVRWLRLRSFLIRTEQGEVARVAGLVADITELKNSLERSRQQEMQLIQADKMATLGVLVSGIAHEINNPNNLVMFNSDLVSRIVKDVTPILDEFYEAHPDRLLGGLAYVETRKELENLLAGIAVGSQRIRDIVAGLKDLARVDTGNMNQQIHINEIVRSSLLIVGNLIRKSTAVFSVDYADDVPAAVGNIQQIEQVVINLITNACHALSKKTQAIRIETRADRAENKVLIIVSDEGAGIPAENLKRLFDPFFTTKRDIGGTGLGLSISYSIVHAHRGELLVQSTEGEGTTVTLSLPVASPEEHQ